MLSIEKVRRALALPRPGWTAQQEMMPTPRPGSLPPPVPPDPRKEAAVLILLYPRGGDLNFVLQQRTDTVATHKGQISLPGGMRENGETLEETARRETREELGLEESVEIIGEPLTPIYIPVSDFWVTAFVGFVTARPLFHFQPDEVVQVIETPLSALLDEHLIREEEWTLREFAAHVPFFFFGGHKVWGATAMMLSEFKALLRATREYTQPSE